MQQGTIKTLLNGFGFIALGEGNKDVFFHAQDLVGVDFESLRVGDVLSFEMGSGNRGPKAINVRLAGASASDTAAQPGAGAMAADDDAADDDMMAESAF